MSDTQQTAEDMRDGQKTVMLSKIEDMQTRFLSSDLARDPAYAAHRDMLHCIHYSTNGASNKIEALAQSIASIGLVIAQDKLDEPARLRDTFLQAHSSVCPVAPLINRNPDGTPNYPWPSRKEVIDFVAELRAEDVKIAASAAAAASSPKSLGSTLRFSLKDGVSASGAVAYLTLLVVVIGVCMYFWSGQRDKTIERVVAQAVATQIRGAMTSAANAGRSADAKAEWDSNKE